MSHETDSFIDEVTEEVRRDRLFALFRRFGWIALAIILIIVAGTAWREYSQAQSRAAAEAWGDAVLAAQRSENPAAALMDLDPAGSTDRAALGALLAAGAQDDKGAVISKLETAANEATDPVLRDLARFKSVLAQGDSMDPAARDAALSELSKPGAPFRLLALEQKAVALVAADRRDDAVTLIREILVEDGVSQALRERLAGMMTALGEAPGANPALPDGADPADDAGGAAPAAAAE